MKTFFTSSEDKRRTAQRRMIFEMIEASIRLSLEKGPHHLKKGCSCIVCIKARPGDYLTFLNSPNELG